MFFTRVWVFCALCLRLRACRETTKKNWKKKKQKKKWTSLPLCAAGAEQPAEFVEFYMVLSESGTLPEPDLNQLNLT